MQVSLRIWDLAEHRKLQSFPTDYGCPNDDKACIYSSSRDEFISGCSMQIKYASLVFNVSECPL